MLVGFFAGESVGLLPAVGAVLSYITVHLSVSRMLLTSAMVLKEIVRVF